MEEKYCTNCEYKTNDCYQPEKEDLCSKFGFFDRVPSAETVRKDLELSKLYQKNRKNRLPFSRSLKTPIKEFSWEEYHKIGKKDH